MTSVAVVAMASGPGAKAQTYDWGGLYIGAHAGWSQSDANVAWPNASAGLQRSFEHSSSGGIFGGQFGVQQQFGNFLLGLEFAAGGSKSNFDTGTPNAGCPNAAFDCGVSALHGLYQIGPRIGLTFNNWLFFVSGGYATASIETRSFNTSTGRQFDSTVQRHGGWYAGGGIEYGLNREWVLGLEYQRVSLDSQQHTSAVGLPADTRVVDADADVVRFRLSYLLNYSRFVADPLK